MKLYIAASSTEMTRAAKWHDLARKAGIEVISTWLATVESAGAGNPDDATEEQRAAWARKDLFEVKSSDCLWLLMPERPSQGAFCELGYAYANTIGIVVSGPHANASIFSALGMCVQTDEEGFADVCRRVTGRERVATP